MKKNILPNIWVNVKTKILSPQTNFKSNPQVATVEQLPVDKNSSQSISNNTIGTLIKPDTSIHKIEPTKVAYTDKIETFCEIYDFKEFTKPVNIEIYINKENTLIALRTYKNGAQILSTLDDCSNYHPHMVTHKNEKEGSLYGFQMTTNPPYRDQHHFKKITIKNAQKSDVDQFINNKLAFKWCVGKKEVSNFTNQLQTGIENSDLLIENKKLSTIYIPPSDPIAQQIRDENLKDLTLLPISTNSAKNMIELKFLDAKRKDGGPELFNTKIFNKCETVQEKMAAIHHDIYSFQNSNDVFKVKIINTKAGQSFLRNTQSYKSFLPIEHSKLSSTWQVDIDKSNFPGE